MSWKNLLRRKKKTGWTGQERRLPENADERDKRDREFLELKKRQTKEVDEITQNTARRVAQVNALVRAMDPKRK